MMKRILILLVLVPVLCSAQGFPFGTKKPEKADTVLIIHAGTLLAMPGETPLTEQTIVVRNEIIGEVVDGYLLAEQIEVGSALVEVVDLKGHFVMPGLFDSHVHLSRATGAYQRGIPTINSQPNAAVAAVNAVINARLNLAAGFTALRDLGSDQTSVFAVRDAISEEKFIGPTIIASGASISVTAGHGDNAASTDPDERARAGVCDGPDECRTLVRHLEKTGSDLVKFKSTGGFSSNTGLNQHMTAAEMQAIVAAAHLRGIKTTTHAYDPAAIIDALDAGVDCLEHGYLLSDDGIRKMERNGTFFVPTLTVAEPPSMVKRFLRGREPISVTMRNEHRAFERAYAKGVKIAFGTDAGIYPHGRNADEFVRMVELGMTPADAIRSATVVAAELFGLENHSGTIEKGKAADIIAVGGSPLTDINALLNVSWVIKAGQIAKRDGVMTLPINYSLSQKY